MKKDSVHVAVTVAKPESRATRIWCECCEEHQPIQDIVMTQDTQFPQQGIWGDIQCDVCKLVIASIKSDQAGTYAITKIAAIDDLVTACQRALSHYERIRGDKEDTALMSNLRRALRLAGAA